MTRTAGLRGRRPSTKLDQFKSLAEYGVSLPSPSYPIDVSAGITSWLMLGNGPDPTLTGEYAEYASTGVGNCGPCTWRHEQMLSVALGRLPASDDPDANQCVGEYFVFDKGEDVGVENSDYLLYLFNQKLIKGFVKLSRTERDQWMSVTGRGVITGVDLTDSDEQEFADGQIWTCSGGQTPDPEDGHDILTVKAQTSTGPRTCITWGAEQEYDGSWDDACASEWWGILVDEDAEWMGADAFNAIVADITALAGTAVPPETPPSPAPAPTPGPVPPVPSPEPTPVPDPAPSPDPDPTPPSPEPTPDPSPPDWLLRRLKSTLAALERDITDLANLGETVKATVIEALENLIEQIGGAT